MPRESKQRRDATSKRDKPLGNDAAQTEAASDGSTAEGSDAADLVEDAGNSDASSTSTSYVPAVEERGTGDQDIRGVLIQVVDARLLLPNATVAEVLAFADPEPVADAPPWLLGKIRWQGWQLPLVAFSKLAGLAEERGALGRKVVVLRALTGNPKAPYFALLTQGFPRLVTVSRDALIDEDPGQGQPLPGCVSARVRLNQDDAFVPDLEAIEQQIDSALAQAA